MKQKKTVKNLQKVVKNFALKAAALEERVKELERAVYGEVEIEFEPDPYLLDPNKEVREQILEDIKEAAGPDCEVFETPKHTLVIEDELALCESKRLGQAAAESGGGPNDD